MKFVKLLQDKCLSLIITSFSLMALTLSGCGSSNAASAEAPPAQTSVQLAWIHGAEYSGFYMAEDKDYYADENLTVELRELGDTSPIEEVVAGKADFGVTSADTLLLARAEGAPVIAIATIYQRSPVAFISLAEKNITRPQDLIGKTVVVHFAGTTGIVYQAMLTAEHIDPAQVNGVPRTDFSNEPLLSGQADVIDAFITNQPIHLAREGYDINAILPSDYGIDIYANIIFTREDLIANNPKLVERFLRATLQGMQSAVDDAESAASLAAARGTDLNLESETQSMQRSLPLINPSGSRPGMMKGEDWEATHQILLDQGVLSEPLDISAAYNLTFLEKIYSQ